MIGQIIKDGKRVYVALMFMRQVAQWRALEGEHETAMDAALECHAAFLAGWREINEGARHLRALCEHPKFREFEADGIDSGMIRSAARLLSERIELQQDNIEHLLDQPGGEDLVCLADGLYEYDPDLCALEPFHIAQMVRPHDDPDIMMITAIHELLAGIREATGKEVSAQGYTDAVVELLLMHPGNEEGDTEVVQAIADSLFQHCVTTSMCQVMAMVGELPRLHPEEMESSVQKGLAMVRPRRPATANSPGQSAKVIPFPQPKHDTSKDGGDKDGGDDGNGGDA